MSSASAKKNAISCAAFSAESLPWMALRSMSVPKRLRMVPGSALRGVRRAHGLAQVRHGVLALERGHDDRALGHERTSASKNGRSRWTA